MIISTSNKYNLYYKLQKSLYYKLLSIGRFTLSLD